jgi:hypothetical protein
MTQKIRLVFAGIVLFAGAAAAAPTLPVTDSSLVLTTARAADPVASCFAQVQERASKPWSFVPRESGGGTFSNAGAPGVSQPYFVKVAARGTGAQVSLTAVSDASVVRAVDACI